MFRDRFNRYNPGIDRYANLEAKIITEDLEPKFSGEPKLSILISTWNRKWQLARTLECLARQNWREFEVLVMDDGSTQDLRFLFNLFSDYLQLKTFQAERHSWRSCASRAFKTMLPETKGKVIAITHPEMMLHHEATYYLYQGCTERKRMKDTIYYTIGNSQKFAGEWYWVSLKPQFLDDDSYKLLDSTNWHEDLDNVWRLPNFGSIKGFANHPNMIHSIRERYPWWFVGAARRECPIWNDMPVIDGHGILDMWMMDYRRIHKIINVTPEKPLCLHQPHLVSAVAPEGEQDKIQYGKEEKI